jgi:hypothetical protein
MGNMYYLLTTLLMAMSFSCGKERPARHVVDNELRLPKDSLSGQFYFLKTIVQVDSPGNEIGEFLFPGTYLQQGNVVKFDFTESRVDIVSTENPLDPSSPRENSAILASFPVQHVDILWQKNSDDRDTRIEEETTTRNSWADRGYVIIDVTADTLDEIPASLTRTTENDGRIEYDQAASAINFVLVKNLTDGSVIREKYSFLEVAKRDAYDPREYSVNEKREFGFFDTVAYSFNKYGRVTNDDLKRYLNRWNPKNPITYYLSENFPDELAKVAENVVDGWNDAFENATGQRPVELKANAGEEMGDMRYSMIYFVDDKSTRGILGYGPSYSDPKTGEIIKADVFLFGSTLKNAIYGEREWIDKLGLDASSIRSTKFRTDLAANASPAPQAIKLGEFNSTAQIPLRATGTGIQVAEIEKRFSTIDAGLREIRESKFRDFRRLTAMTPDVLQGIQKLALADAEISDEDMEIRIFGPLLAHEMGHNFGLRHNFMGSADKEFHSDDVNSSTVMDYTFLASKSSSVPGAYDEAALQFGYGDEERQADSLAKSYSYCTDEDLVSSREPLCAQFDWGTTLEEVVQNQFEKYTTSYEFINLRGDRAFFNENPDGYISSVFANLVPMRLAIDHANVINELVNSGYQPGTDSEKQIFGNLWELLGKRMEATDDSDATNIVEVEVSDGVTKKFDISRIQALEKDAINARDLAVDALLAIVIEELRPNYDGYDPLNRELAVRGVLYDKLIAMLLLAMDTPDPLGRGGVATAFTDRESDIGNLFVQIISDSRATTAGRNLYLWDTNLRRMAVNLLREVTLPGKQTSEMIELISLLDFNPSGLTGQEKVDYDAIYLPTTGHDDKIKNLFVQALDPDVTDAQIDVISANLDTESSARLKRNFAAVRIKDRYFKSPISLDLGGLLLTSATGLLMRDVINQMDIRVDAYTAGIDALETKMAAETDTFKLLQMAQLHESYQNSQSNFRRFSNQEKRFLEEIFTIYQPYR